MSLGLRELVVLLACGTILLLGLSQEGDLQIEGAWFQPVEFTGIDTHGGGVGSLGGRSGPDLGQLMTTYANGIAPTENEIASDKKGRGRESGARGSTQCETGCCNSPPSPLVTCACCCSLSSSPAPLITDIDGDGTNGTDRKRLNTHDRAPNPLPPCSLTILFRSFSPRSFHLCVCVSPLPARGDPCYS